MLGLPGGGQERGGIRVGGKAGDEAAHVEERGPVRILRQSSCIERKPAEAGCEGEYREGVRGAGFFPRLKPGALTGRLKPAGAPGPENQSAVAAPGPKNQTPAAAAGPDNPIPDRRPGPKN